MLHLVIKWSGPPDDIKKTTGSIKLVPSQVFNSAVIQGNGSLHVEEIFKIIYNIIININKSLTADLMLSVINQCEKREIQF